MTLETIGIQAKKAVPMMQKMNTTMKNTILKAVGERLIADESIILAANEKDMDEGQKNGLNTGLLDRLALTRQRIADMAEGLYQLTMLEDPIGEVLQMKKRPNGLIIGERRVPLGVIGIIYEARPNVTTDAFGLCFKTGNVVVLKGVSDAIHSNQAIIDSIQAVLEEHNIDRNAIQLIADTNRETTTQFMKMKEYIDILIPRGGAGLIQAVVNNSTIPVIETGTGNCHIYVDETADINMALASIINAKTQRIGVCNACESLLIHEKVAEHILPLLAEQLECHQVEVRGDEVVCRWMPKALKATDADWGTEYLDYIISIKTVDSLTQAIAHINQYNTKHSEAIITSDYAHAQQFLDEVDAAAVYVNASTRYTDGFEFGFGAEIGISTQKLHARGPMGLTALTTTKYIIYGNGQVRP